MRITADTNVLVRIIVADDLAQARLAARVLSEAETVFIPLPGLCEFVWVLDAVYRLRRAEIALAVRAIIERANVSTDIAAVNVGLDLLEAGGDFADGVIAAAGRGMGADSFVSFDRKALARVASLGVSAIHPDHSA